jgi:hypothetical protein
MATLTLTDILSILDANPRAVDRAMVVLFYRQTEDEKRLSEARYLNGRGFSAADAKTGTYYARWVLGGRQLSGWHLRNAREMAKRYVRQLLEAAEAKAAAKAGAAQEQAA